MALTMFMASAPGTLMIAGEHAVLHNKKALVAAVDKRIQVTLTPRSDKQIILKSQLGELIINLDDFCSAEHTPPKGGVLYNTFRFVLEAIKVCIEVKYAQHIKIEKNDLSGFELNIHSEFSHTVGLGSSAAVTVATVSALLQYLSILPLAAGVLDDALLKTVFAKSRDVIRRVQGYGSGADVAAAVYGGVILYQKKNSLSESKSASDLFLIKKLSKLIPIVCVYSGSKKSTSEVIAFVTERQKKQPDLFATIFNAIDASVLKSVTAIELEDWKSLGEIWQIQQGFMTAMGVSNLALDHIIHNLNAEPSIYGAKISGSGLGDCVIGLGTLPKNKVMDDQIVVSLTGQGLSGHFEHEIRHPRQIPVSQLTKNTVVKNLLRDKTFIPIKPIGKAFAPSNIALCKYWGKRDHELNLPLTSSLSISLGYLGAQTEISILNDNTIQDAIVVNGVEEFNNTPFSQKCSAYLDLFRPTANTYYQIQTQSNIPIGAGLASSACGFAALIMALDDLYGWQLNRPTLSQLARIGSGSASRSLWHGFVEWERGNLPDGSDSHGVSLLQFWPELCIGLLIVNQQEKILSSRIAMKLTEETSPFYKAWPSKVNQDLPIIKDAICCKNFKSLGETAESNALAMHALMMSSKPSIIYSESTTFELIQKVQTLRRQGLAIYFTQDAGPNLKLIFLEQDKNIILQEFPLVQVVQPFAEKFF
jgi:diphosphomevalonate decarboxylase